MSTNTEVTSLAFINGYSILVVGTSEGIAYFVRILKTEHNYKISTIGLFRSRLSEPIINVTVDLLIKGFSLNK